MNERRAAITISKEQGTGKRIHSASGEGARANKTPLTLNYH